MSTTRIKDLTTASGIADDDYIVVDGATNGTRKALASDVGGSEQMYSITSTSTNSGIDTRGVGSVLYSVTPKDPSEATMENLAKMKAFACTLRDPDATIASASAYIKWLYITQTSRHPQSSVILTMKCCTGSPQATSAIYLDPSYVTVIAPFEMTAISVSM